MTRRSRFLQSVLETTTQLFHAQILQKLSPWSLCKARPCEGRTWAGVCVCMTSCVGSGEGQEGTVLTVKGLLILTAADISCLEELSGEQN